MQGNIETRVGLFVLAAFGVFIFMGFRIGSFRFDRNQYTSYTVQFSDVSGLSRKADIKIAGVKVGWVQSVQLTTEKEFPVEAIIMVRSEYRLYSNAAALVRQDGLLGPKYLEIIPGDPLTTELKPGSTLAKPSQDTVSIDKLLQEFKHIASNVHDVTESFKQTLGTTEGRELLRDTTENLHATVKQIASFTEVLDRSFTRNEENIDALLGIGSHIARITDTIDKKILPNFNESVIKISEAVDRDFNRIAARVESTSEALEDASIEARDGLRNLSSVAQKIDEGKGMLGKLINDEDTYSDLQAAIQGFKQYVNKMERLQIVFDSHFEGMQRPGDHYYYEDGKGYFDIRIHPNEDHFYLLQLVSSQRGFKYQNETAYVYRNDDQQIISLDDLRNLEAGQLNKFSAEKTFFKRNALLFSLQFGKIYKNIAFRFGLFENCGGLALDCEIPFRLNNFRWVTSLELFDFVGWNKVDDRRPHAKWINRMYVLENIYMVFGADDFASKRNASIFLGGGIRFGDEDVKYLLSSVSGGGAAVACCA